MGIDFIKILLWMENYSELVYFIFGGIEGWLVGNFTRQVKVPIRGKGGEVQYECHRRPNLRNVFLGVLIVAFLVALSIVNNLYTDIPDVLNFTYEEASAKLHLAGLSCTENYGRYGDVVIDIRPSAEYVRSGSMIELTLGRQEVGDESAEEVESHDYETIMPDVYLVQEQAALVYLEVAGFTNVQTLPQYTDTTVAGYVLRSEPFSGEPINYDDRITLYVSVNEVR